MPELFQEMYYGPNVQNLVESDDCKVMRLFYSLSLFLEALKTSMTQPILLEL